MTVFLKVFKYMYENSDSVLPSKTYILKKMNVKGDILVQLHSSLMGYR